MSNNHSFFRPEVLVAQRNKWTGPVGWVDAMGAGIFSVAGGYNIGRGMMKP